MGLSLGQTIQINQRRFIGVVILIITTMVVFYKFRADDTVGQQYKSLDFNHFIDLRHLLSASIDAAKRGGYKVYKIRESASLQEQSKGKTLEGANDPVTDGDMQSHLEMFHSIKNAFSGVTIISEEKTTHSFDGSKVLPANIQREELNSLSSSASEIVDAKDIQIWIDPLDATQEYTENLREYVTTMVCVAVKGAPVIGVIHKPFQNLTAWAWVGKSHNPKLEVNVNKNAPLPSPPRVIVSRSHSGDVIAEAQKALGQDIQVTTAGGAGYKVLEVLSGRQDVYFHSTLIKKWDICAGNAILNHFNGHMTNIQGFILDYSSALHYKNPDGLIAALYHHDYFLEKLG